MTQNVQYKRVDDKDNGRPPFGLATCDGWVTVLPYGIGYQSGSVQSVLLLGGKMAHTWKHTDERWKDAYNELPMF